MGLDSLEYSLFRYESSERKLAFRARTLKEARAWQAKLRRKLRGLLGGFPRRVPLEPEVSERTELEGYTRETVIFRSREGLEVFSYFLVPKEWPMSLTRRTSPLGASGKGSRLWP